MGAYLSEPVKEKKTEEGSDERLSYAATCMQGWRVNQEDAHNCILEFGEGASLFAVYDGHGGAEVSEYVATHFPPFLRDSEAWKANKIEESLASGFLTFDEHLTTPAAIAQLKVLAGHEDDQNDKDEEGNDASERAMLFEEAALPIEDLLQRYGVMIRDDQNGKGKKRGKNGANGNAAAAPEPGAGSDNNSKNVSPNIRPKRSNLSSSNNTSNCQQSDEEATNGTTTTHPPKLDLKEKVGEGESEDAVVKAVNGGDEASSDMVGIGKTEPPLPPTPDKDNSSNNNDSNKQDIANTVKTETDNHTSSSPSSAPTTNNNKNNSRSNNSSENEDQHHQDQHEQEQTTQNGETVNSPKLKKKKLSTENDTSPQTLSRQRSSKSESEVRVLKAEEEKTGPISNWSTMGLNDNVEGRRSTTGTPETATAASSDEQPAESDSDDGDSDYVEKDKPPKGVDEESSDDDGEGDGNDDGGESTSSEGEDDDGADEEGDGVEEGEEDDDDDDDDIQNFPAPSGDTPGVDSGTTACVAVLSQGSLYVANVGDSRCVLSRNGKALDMSIDHKPEDEIERTRIEKAGGKITADGRVNGGLNLSRALGDHFYKQTPRMSLAQQMISSQPDIQVQKLDPELDSYFVIACDGIWNSMESQEVIDFISERMKKGTSIKSICEQLCEHCLADDTSGDGTGCDNMTVVIVRLDQHSANGRQQQASSATASASSS